MAKLNAELFRSLDSSLAHIVAAEPATIRGSWFTSSRRVYESAQQAGSGSGPFVDVIDARWKATLVGPREIGVVFFSSAATTLRWAKCPSLSASLPVEVSLHAYADYRAELASFAASVEGCWLTTMPVKADRGADLTKICSFGPENLSLGRVTLLAQTQGASFSFLALPRETLKMGRHRLWRLREELATPLPEAVRQLLTRGRTGVVEL